MALTTFGAIMGFAAEMVRQGEETYRVAVQRAKDPGLRDGLKDLLAEETKNRSLMERTRREHVTEMILEPITGLRQEEYEIEVQVPAGAVDCDLLKIALAVEEKELKFFKECSAKIPLPEVANIFRKVARKKESNLTRLRSLVLA
jgi:rubrerythrin